MITHFNPNPSLDNQHSYIALYRDNEDPYTFYYVNGHPRISIEKETNKPAFDYMVIGRDIKKEGSQGVQEGRLVMSVNLALTDDEMNAVEKAVQSFVDTKKFEEDLPIYYKKYAESSKNDSVQGKRTLAAGILKTIAKRKGKAYQVCIKPINYTTGKASINLASSDFSGNYNHETKPTLFGDCSATFSVNLDAQESQILYEIFKPKDQSDTDANISTTINYEMKYNTVVPFEATATIHYQRIYQEIQDLVKTHSGIDSKYYGTYSLPCTGRTYHIIGADLYVSKENLDDYLKNSDTVKQNIEIKINNSSNSSENDKYEELLLTALQNQLVQNVSEKLFEKAQPLSPSDVSGYDVKTTGSKESESSESKRNVLYDVSYKLRTDIDTTVTSDFNMVISKDKVIEAEANPSGSLILLLKDSKLDSLVRELDASDIYFQEMLVPITVDDTNFGRDIAMISVRVTYKGKNGNVKLDKVFNFDEENPSTKTFRVIMDRNANRELIDKFYYRTRIRYRGYDVYDKTTREDDKWTKEKETQGIGEGIYVPYSDIRNLCVKCEAGDVAWDIVEKLAIEFKYKDAPEKSGATKLMTLTEANPSDTWNCFMYKDSDSYIYRIHYFYYDGTDDWSQEFEGSSKTDKLIVNDKLSGVFRAKFDINFKKSVERARIIVKCQGKEEDSGWIYEPSTWTWQSRLKEDRDMTYQYKTQYYLVNASDSVVEKEWSAPIQMNTESNQQSFTIDLQINQISLIIDGESIDWNKWSRVYLHFKYDDDANGLHYDDETIEPLKLSSSKTEGTIVIPVVNETIRPVIYAEYVPLNGDDVISSEEKTAGKIVILPNAVPPKCDVISNAEEAPSSTTKPSSQEQSSTPEATSSSKLEKQTLDLTFSVKSMDWDKWYAIGVHIKYDDDVNGIHYNDSNPTPFIMNSKSEDKTITLKIKDSSIKPIITIDYTSKTGEESSSASTPISGTIVNIPADVPPQS